METQTPGLPVTQQGQANLFDEKDLATTSRIEEIIAALWSIAALLAWNGGITWLAIILFVKAGLDILCAIAYAIKDAARYLSARVKNRTGVRVSR